MQHRAIQRGDVYWATYVFPHEWDDGIVEDVEKQRPILVVQNNMDNQNILNESIIAEKLLDAR